MNATPALNPRASVLRALASGPATMGTLIRRTGFRRSAVYSATSSLRARGKIVVRDRVWWIASDREPDPSEVRAAKIEGLPFGLARCYHNMGDGWSTALQLVGACGLYPQHVRRRLVGLHAMGLVERDGPRWRRL